MKLNLRERAKIALGDFPYTEEMLQQKMKELAARNDSTDPSGKDGSEKKWKVPPGQTSFNFYETEKPKRRGRPKKIKDGAAVSIWIDTETKTILEAKAAAQGLSNSEFIRNLIRHE